LPAASRCSCGLTRAGFGRRLRGAPRRPSGGRGPSSRRNGGQYARRLGRRSDDRQPSMNAAMRSPHGLSRPTGARTRPPTGAHSSAELSQMNRPATGRGSISWRMEWKCRRRTRRSMPRSAGTRPS
jgi:hypothetical protein